MLLDTLQWKTNILIQFKRYIFIQFTSQTIQDFSFFFGVLIPLKRKYIYFLAKKVITKITYIHCDFMYLKLLNVKLWNYLLFICNYAYYLRINYINFFFVCIIFYFSFIFLKILFKFWKYFWKFYLNFGRYFLIKVAIFYSFIIFICILVNH